MIRSAAASLAALACSTTALAGFTTIEADDFDSAPVVGVDAIDPLGARTIGFDITPDGSDIQVPNASGALLFSDSISNLFLPVGLIIDPNAVAVTQPSNPAGLGVRSGDKVLAAGIPSNGTITFVFVQGASAAGFCAQDGPTNEVVADFFDTSGGLIASLAAVDNSDYLGIASDDPIGSIVIRTTASDDYYVEDLSFTPVPAPAALMTLAVGLAMPLRRRR